VCAVPVAVWHYFKSRAAELVPKEKSAFWTDTDILEAHKTLG